MLKCYKLFWRDWRKLSDPSMLSLRWSTNAQRSWLQHWSDSEKRVSSKCQRKIALLAASKQWFCKVISQKKAFHSQKTPWSFPLHLEKVYSWIKVSHETKKNFLYSFLFIVLESYTILMKCFTVNIYWQTITAIKSLGDRVYHLYQGAFKIFYIFLYGNKNHICGLLEIAKKKTLRNYMFDVLN